MAKPHVPATHLDGLRTRKEMSDGPESHIEVQENSSNFMMGKLVPGLGLGCLDRHSVLLGPLLHDPDDILHLGVSRAPQQVQHFPEGLPEEGV